MTLLGSLFKERAVKSEHLWGRWARGDDSPIDVALSGVRVTRESAMQLSAVWACVSLISDSISTLPLDTFIRRNGTREPFRRPAWIDDPNPDQPLEQWVSQQLLALLLDGTAFVYTVRGQRGDVLEAWNVPPWNVTVKRENRRVVYDVHDPDSGLMTTLGQDRMFHIPAMSWPGQLRGMAPLEAAKHMLGAGLGAQEFAERFYGQGTLSSGIIEAPEDITIEQAREIKQDFQRVASGMRKAHLPAVLTKGASWKPMTVSPEQAQFLETRAFSVNEIARFFRVAPHMIADVEKSTSWGTGIEQQGIGFVTYTLMPWLTRLERAYSTWLLNRPFQSQAFAKFNVNGLMRGDIKTRFETYQIARLNGLMNADEIRALEDQPPLPDGAGEEYWRPANIGVVGQETQQPAPTPPEGT